MLNIISKAYLSKTSTGPKKVVDNLIKGLDLLGYPYVVNKRLDACGMLWIHDDTEALASIGKLDDSIKIVAGPNLYVVARQIPQMIDLSKIVYLQPSEWTKDLWVSFGFDRCPVEAWPTGIDTEEYKPSTREKKTVLVYFKQRSQEELARVREALDKKNIAYQIIHYGNYKEEDYKQLLGETRYIVWLGRQESQGIALQEALAADVPILVCDVDRLGHWEASPKEMAVFTEEENNYTGATSAAYFDERCGIKIKDLATLGGALDTMECSLGTFRPRQYILENLSLEKQARALLAMYEKYFGITFDQGRSDVACKRGNWRNNTLYFKIYMQLKRSIKQLVRPGKRI